MEQGEEIVEFGGKVIEGGKVKAEYDIITKTKLIECKNTGSWEKYFKVPKDIEDFKIKLRFAIQNAQDWGLTFELHSTSLVHPEIKQWCIENSVKFLEGIL